jgi:dienelactone hydrolase
MPACPLLKLAVFAFLGLSSLLFEAQAKPSLVQNYYGEKVAFSSIEPGEKSRPVWGYISVPKNAATPAPAMVLVHGSGGLSGREARYVEEYNKLGIVTLVVAPFEVRGVRKTMEDQSLVTGAEMNSDAIGALKLLQADKRIDPQRIGIQGASKGGNVALSLAFDGSFQSRKVPKSMRFALHIPIYPGCSTQQRNPKTIGKPILLLIGELDDYSNPQHCREYAASIKRMGGAIEFVSYLNAHHDFDGPDNLRLHWLPKVQNARDCAALLEDDGSVIEPSTGTKWRTFAAFQNDYLDQAKRPCVKHGAHVGNNAAAKKKSLEDMTGFFRRTGFLQ